MAWISNDWPLPCDWHQRAGGDHRTAGRRRGDFVGVIRQRVLRHDLDRIETRTVADVDERQSGLRIAPRAHPAAHGDFGVRRDRTGKGLFDADDRHALKLLNEKRHVRHRRKREMIADLDVRKPAKMARNA